MNRADAPKKQPIPFAVNGQREDLLTKTPAGDNSASYDAGFPPVTMILKAAGGLPPKGQNMNQIIYELSCIARWFSAGGMNAFDAEFSTGIGGYPMGATVLGNDGSTRYMNTIESNTSDPNSGGAGWFNLSSGYLKTSNYLSEIKDSGSSAMASAVKNIGLGTGLTGVIGEARNAKMFLTSVSTTANFTADELIVAESLGGLQYRLGNLNKTINISTVGVGGMDIGSAPNSGFVAIYVVYNPTTNESALIASNATNAIAPELYSGGSMPTGYSASALVSLWQTTPNGLLNIGSQDGRKIATPLNPLLSTTGGGDSNPPYAVSLVSGVPKNAKEVNIYINVSGSSVSDAYVAINMSAATSSLGYGTATGTSSPSASFSMPILTSQMLYQQVLVSSGTATYTIFSSGYLF